VDQVNVNVTPTLRRCVAQKYYLTDDTSSDYGCKRLNSGDQHEFYIRNKQACREHPYSCHSHQHNHNHSLHHPMSSNFIEHIYECIDEDPYVAKLLLPAIHRSLEGHQMAIEHARTLSDSSRHSDHRPLIGVSSSSTSQHQHHHKSIPKATTNVINNHLPAIVRDNTASIKTTIICASPAQSQCQSQTQSSVAVLNGKQQVICCTLSDHELCQHKLLNNISHSNQHSNHNLNHQMLFTNSCLPSISHLSSDC